MSIGLGLPCSDWFCEQWAKAGNKPVNYFEYEFYCHLHQAFDCATTTVPASVYETT